MLKNAWICRVLIVTFLTLFSNCALFKASQPIHEDDPIARAAFSNRFSSDEEDSMREEHRFQQEQEIQYGLAEGALVYGMKMDDVIAIWGQPRDVETAGDPRNGNQKWIYSNRPSNRWSLESFRIVYFESGTVVGWQVGR